MPGALTTLYWWGTILPCFEKEEDKSARQSLSQLHSVGKRITWQCGNSHFKSPVGKLKSLFSSVTSTARGGIGGNKPPPSDSSIDAKFTMVDNDDGIPEIRIVPLVGGVGSGFSMLDNNNDDSETDNDDSEHGGGGTSDHNDRLSNIPLKRIQFVQTDGRDCIILLAANTNPDNPKSKPRELLRFCVTPETERNNFVHNLHVIMEWDRQRRQNVGELEYEEHTIASRARKAAHFAKREIEMKQTKANREKRKAKYVFESGGLKYTALAMASRST